MVYTSPTKVARIVTLDKEGHPRNSIAQTIGIHRTTVARIISRFDKSGDFYHVNPKTGRPRKFDDRDTRVAARILAKEEARNAVELAKKHFPKVSAKTIGRRLKEGGMVCRVHRAKPYLTAVFFLKKIINL